MKRRKFLAFFGIVPSTGFFGFDQSSLSNGFNLFKDENVDSTSPVSPERSREFLNAAGFARGLRCSCERAINRQIAFLKNLDAEKMQSLNLTESEKSKFAEDLEQQLFAELNADVGSYLSEGEIQDGLKFFSSESGKKIINIYERLQVAGTPVIDKGSVELLSRFNKA